MSSASVADRLGVEDLFSRYARALDEGDVEGIAACFTEDGELVSPTVGSHRGRDGIRTFAARFAALRAGGTQLRHMITNIEARVDGDRAEATAYLIAAATRGAQSEFLPPGRYVCSLRKVEGRWLFARRVVEHDAPFTIPGMR